MSTVNPRVSNPAEPNSASGAISIHDALLDATRNQRLRIGPSERSPSSANASMIGSAGQRTAELLRAATQATGVRHTSDQPVGSQSSGVDPVGTDHDYTTEVPALLLTVEQCQKLEDFDRQARRMAILTARVKCRTMEVLYGLRRPLVAEIPQFWLNALFNHYTISLEIRHTEDMAALKYLEDIWVVRDQEDHRVYTIEFTFGKNPFFHDLILKKVFQYVPNQGTGTQPADEDGFKWGMLDFDWDRNVKPRATQIDWKETNLCHQYPLKSSDQERLPKELGSFFNWFTHPNDAFHMGVIIAEQIFPNAIDYAIGRYSN